MDNELEQRIYDAAPVFFRNRTLPATQTCMCWGIECGDGWYGPLLQFAKEAEVINGLLKPYNSCVVADQVKSKWADICVYWHMATLDETANVELDDAAQETVRVIDRLFEKAVEKLGEECERTCEICGKKGNYYEDIITCGSWLTRKCRACAQKIERDRGQVMFFRDGFNFLSPYFEGPVKCGTDAYGCFLGMYYSQLCPEHRVIFHNMKNPREVQSIAFDMGICRQDDEAVEVMRRILPYKFHDEKLNSLFYGTKGLDLVFSNQIHENFWGSCICKECQDKEHHNHYGKLLMELRDGNRKEEK